MSAPSKESFNGQEAFPSTSPDPLQFASSNIAVVATVVRLALVGGIVPREWRLCLESRAVQSILINPIYTLSHVREAVAIRRLVPPHRFPDAYQGNNIHLPPLMLAAAEPIVESVVSEYWQRIGLGLILLSLDYYIAVTLERVCLYFRQQEIDDDEAKLYRQMPGTIRPQLTHIFPLADHTPPSHADKVNSSPPYFRTNQLGYIMAAMYYASPVIVLGSSLLICFQNIALALILTGLHYAAKADHFAVTKVALVIAVASYVDLHALLFSVPCAVMLAGRKNSVRAFACVLCIMVVILQALSCISVGWTRYPTVAVVTHGYRFQFVGLAPSLSTMWYFGMEVFDRFHRYFTILLGFSPYVLVAPMTVRLSKYPEALVAIFWFSGAFFRSTATLFDFNVTLCLILLSPRSLTRLNGTMSLISFCAMLVPISLYVVLYGMWMETGSGEANFLFFQCLAFNIMMASLLLQFGSATLQRDKAIRLTLKAAGLSKPSAI